MRLWGDALRSFCSRLDPIAKASIVAFLVLVPLFYLFPYMGDDWAWGSLEGEERFLSGFAGYNGRWAGNLVVLVLTRSRVCRALVGALVVALIIGQACKLASCRGVSSYLVCALLFFAMPAQVAGQGFVWTSGFSNYATSALFMLLVLNCCKDVFREADTNPSPIAAFFLGLFGSLFIENITIFLFLVAVAANIAYWRTSHCTSKVLLALMAGIACGSVLMFSNSAYWAVAQGRTTYRTINFDILGRLAYLVQNLTFQNFALLVFCCLVSFAASFASLRGGAGGHMRLVPFLLALALCAAAAVSAYGMLAAPEQAEFFSSVWCSCVIACAAVLFLVQSFYSLRGRDRTMLLVCVASIVFVVAPLVIVNPVGPRNFLAPYVLEMVACLLFWKNCIEHRSFAYDAVVAVALVVLMAYWYVAFADVYRVEQRRAEAIHEVAVGEQDVLYLEKLPHPEYLHWPDPEHEGWARRYRLFHGVDADVPVEIDGQRY